MYRSKSSRWMMCGVAAMVATGLGCRAADRQPDDLALCLDEARRANAAHDIERERRVLTHVETLQGRARFAHGSRPPTHPSHP
jgi:hypothetical protein